MNSSNNTRIAKNSLFLYLRMIVVMVVSLYTSRIILHSLGAEDFGIYNVVGGVIMMAGFLNTALSVASSRYLTYELGRGDLNKLKNTFAASLNLHIFAAVAVLLLGETLGFWFVCDKLVIPEDRMNAAIWVYQFSIFTMMINFTQVPYNSALIAHEKMSVYAYVGLYEAVSKLLISYVIAIGPIDRLILYSLLLFVNSCFIQLFYRGYTIRNYQECHFAIVKDTSIYKSLFSYSGWNLVGGFSYVIQGQGISILLNIFFGPIVNAARAVTTQVQNALLQFVGNFLTAVRPQIIKSYAQGDKEGMYALTFKSAKYSIYMLIVLMLPICFELKYILHLWLGDTAPEETFIFTEIVLVTTLVDMYCQAINMPFSAIGKMKQGNLGGGIIQMLAFPIAYIFLYLGCNSYYVFIAIFLTIVAKTIFMWVLVYKYEPFSWKTAVREVFIRTGAVLVVSLPIPTMIVYILDDNFIRFMLLTIISEFFLCLIVYFIGLNSLEKDYVKQFVNRKIYKK